MWLSYSDGNNSSLIGIRHRRNEEGCYFQTAPNFGRYAVDLFYAARRLAIEASMATRALLPTRSPQGNAEAVAKAAQAKVFAQAYSSLSQPGALPVSGLNSGSKGFSTICYGVGRSRIGTSETTRRTRCTDRLEWLRVSSHFCRVIPKYTRLTALI
jgi:hypothetical protein